MARILGAPGVDWVRQALRNGHEFSTAVLPEVEAGLGEVRVYLPPTIPEPDANRFGAAIFTNRGLGGEVARSQNSAITDASESGGDLLVLETAVPADRQEQMIFDKTLYPPERAILGKTILFWRPLPDPDPDAVAGFISDIGGYDNAFVVRTGNRLAALQSKNWPELARLVTAILVPVYDAESFVVWKPAQSGR